MPFAPRRAPPHCPIPPPPRPARPATASRGYDYDWQILSDLYRQQHPICQVCHQRLSELVHHIRLVTTHPELRLDPGNLQAVCRPCHAAIHRAAGDYHH